MLVGGPGSRSEFQCASVLAAQGLAESEISISTRRVISISHDIFIFQANVLAAQGLVESESCISIRCVTSMSNDTFVFQASVFTAQGHVEREVGFSMMYALC